ncbi:MAG: aldo/keto reductase family oxidoreductase [Anaerorhabdus sp.]
MKYQKLGNTDLKVSRVALGMMRIAGKSQQEAVEVIKTALDSGINFFDHADIYGGGKSEIVFREAMKEINVPRSSYVIQSKCSIRGNVPSYDFSYEYIIESVDGILERLGTEYIDVLLLHRPDMLWEPSEVNRAFHELYDSGKVKHFGVSNMNIWQMKYLQKNLDFKLVANQLQFSIMHSDLVSSGTYTNMKSDQSMAVGLIDYTRYKEITIQAWSPFQYGFFEGSFLDNPKFPELNEKLQEIAEKYTVGKEAVAVAWINTHPAMIQTVVGTMTPSRIIESSKGADIILTRAEWYEIYKAAGNRLP